ncbi:MAG TPA: universal stress protein [Steroidobacteraceae bacterium]|jgi:nucleotide-binding universal stress UspA family protein
MSYKRILVPVDGSPTAAKGMKEAIKLARRGGGKLMLLHVVEEYAAFASPEVGFNIGPILDAVMAGGKRTLARVKRSAELAGARPQTALVENFAGRVADVIVSEAKRWRADLIVMGTHGRRGVKRALLGSDAELVVRYSPVPVLLVPAHGRGKGRRR